MRTISRRQSTGPGEASFDRHPEGTWDGVGGVKKGCFHNEENHDVRRDRNLNPVFVIEMPILARGF
jgi:hypothetical protein